MVGSDLDEVVTITVLTASNNEVKLVKTRTGHFASLKLPYHFKRINTLDCGWSYWQILTLVCPRKTT